MTYKAKSITSKASSAVKMNMALIEGDREVGAIRKAGAADFIAGMGLGDKKEKKKVEAVDVDTTDTTDEKENSPAPLRSPAKLPIGAIMKAAPMILGALGNKDKDKDSGGGKTTVVVNQPSGGAQAKNSQASNAIDPK